MLWPAGLHSPKAVSPLGVAAPFCQDFEIVVALASREELVGFEAVVGEPELDLGHFLFWMAGEMVGVIDASKADVLAGLGRQEFESSPSSPGATVSADAPTAQKKAASKIDDSSHARTGRASRSTFPAIAHSGILSCFFHGFSRSLLRSILNARAMRRRVECGMITSST